MSRFVVGAVVLGFLSLAGCLGGDDPDDGDVDTPADRLLPEPPPGVVDLEGLPLPDLDGAAHVALMTHFVETYAPRLTGTPGDDAAAAYLLQQLEGFGYATEVHTFGSGGETVPPLEQLPGQGKKFKALVAIRPGTENPDHWVAWGGHYDTTLAFTVQGAYDNGSGTIMAVELARLLANATTNKTLAVFLFNGEEEGLVASGEFASWFVAQQDRTLDAYVNFDMVGINWPSAGNPLGAWVTDRWADALVPTLEYVMHDVVGVPRNETTGFVTSPNTRNSDEASFEGVGVPTVRYAGLRSAGAYWGYHEANDTMATIYEQAGGAEVFAQGLETAAACSYWTVLALDRMAPPTASE